MPRSRTTRWRSPPTPPPKSTWNQWVVLSEEEEDGSVDAPDNACVAHDAAAEVVLVGPLTPESRAQLRALKVAAKAAMQGMTGGNELVEKLDIEIKEIDHATHAAKPPREQLKAAGWRVSRAQIKQDKAVAATASSLAI